MMVVVVLLRRIMVAVLVHLRRIMVAVPVPLHGTVTVVLHVKDGGASMQVIDAGRGW